MRYRPLGRTGILVSEIGFGAWGIGGATPGATSYGPTDDATSRRALEAAFDCGITFYDTANVYGAGRSERLIGETFQGRRDRVVIATKAGSAAYDAAPDFSARALRDSVAGSLERLRTDHVDILQLHDPDPDQPELDEAVEGLERLRADGLIRAIGVSLRAPEDGLVLLGRYGLDAIQVNLNLLDPRADDCGLLARAGAAQVGIIARTPLCFGFLVDGADPERAFDAADHRSAWPRSQIRRWAEGGRTMGRMLAAPRGEPLARLALRYCLAHPSVASVIPGILTPEEARENAAAGDAGPLSPDVFAEAKRIYASQRPFAAADRPEAGPDYLRNKRKSSTI